MPLYGQKEIINHRYQVIRRLGNGSTSVVFEVYDKLADKIVALKRVFHQKNATHTLKNSYFQRTVQESRQLVQEFRILASLRHPNIVNVLDYGFDQQQIPFLVMENVPEAATILQDIKTLDVEQRIDLFTQLVQAIAYLHHRNIIHSDLKPDNVLVINGQVKIIDFGLAIERQPDTEGDTASGTVPYMAPELISNGVASKASDMYAVGMIGYEMFAEVYPYPLNNVMVLISSIMNATPDASLMKAPDYLVGIIMELLQKDPAQRLVNPNLVLQKIVSATQRPIKFETMAKDSFIQAAAFIGRETELQRLTSALEASAQSRGGLWLVGGESGVGKSRLLDELRIVAQSTGMIVINAQSVTAAANPLMLWSPVMRFLTLTTEYTPLEKQVLKALLPDLETMLGESVSDAPHLEPDAARERLLRTIENIILRQTEPLLIILEDLQWAGDAIDVIKHLYVRLPTSPILIVASYRDEERPSLPHEVGAKNIISLKRFPKSDISVLSNAILGVEPNEKFLEVIEAETEGNAFFIVEVMRFLAQEAGEFEKVAFKTLPLNLTTGGMKNVLRRRLDQVPEDCRYGLELAAVIGRSINPDLLEKALPELSIQGWLLSCSNVAVIEFFDGQWRFSHDKLREAVIDNLSLSDRQARHRLVAQTLELVYGDAKDKASTLAYHWQQANDIPKEGHYSLIAGEYSQEVGALKESVVLLQRAFIIHTDLKSPVDTITLIQQMLSRAYWNLGRLEDSFSNMLSMLNKTGLSIPKSTTGFVLGTLFQITQQAGYRLMSWVGYEGWRNQKKRYHSILVQKIIIYGAMYGYFNNKTLLTLYFTFLRLNIFERIESGVDAETASTYANVGLIAGLMGMHRLARMYLQMANDKSFDSQDLATVAVVHQVIAVYGITRAEWQTTIDSCRLCIDYAQQAGDLRRYEEGLLTEAFFYQYTGKYLEAYHDSHEYGKSAVQREDVEMEGWAKAGKARLIVIEEDYTGALALAQESLNLFLQVQDVGYLMIHGLLAQIYLRLGEIDKAQTYAKEAERLISPLPPTIFTIMDAYIGIAEVYLKRFELEHTRENQNLAQKGLKIFARYANTFVIGQPRHALYQSRYHRLIGDSTKAKKWALQGIKKADEYQMPLDKQLCQDELAHIETPTHDR